LDDRVLIQMHQSLITIWNKLMLQSNGILYDAFNVRLTVSGERIVYAAPIGTLS
jgi:hypothetical protein